MYDINLNFVKKGMILHVVFLVAGLFIATVILLDTFTVNERVMEMDNKVLSKKVVIDKNKVLIGKVSYTASYYYEVNGTEYVCKHYTSDVKPGDKNKKVYYDSKNPSKCTVGYFKTPKKGTLICIFIPVILLLVGGINILKINKRIKVIKNLNINGKLVKNLPYELKPTNVSINGENIKKPVVEYTLPSGVIVPLYGDPRHDNIMFDNDGLIDLVIDEKNPNNYFLDYNINRISGNLPEDFYIDPNREKEGEYLTNKDAKGKSIEFTTLSEEEFDSLRNE